MTADQHPFGTSRVTRVVAGDASVTWWGVYAQALFDAGLPPESRQAVEDDADYIVERCVLPAGDARWPPSHERRGAVMGAVQSGKTASMMAVIAKALDRGIDGVVVLAGTRTALWLQTLARIDEQLDRLTGASTARVRMPPPGQQELVGGELGSLYTLTGQQARRALDRGRPLLAVVMKNVSHLERLSRTLHETVYPVVAERGQDFHLLVIDDEADDSSIDDPAAGPAAVRQVPRRILDLWESRRAPGVTAVPNLYATYIAYTATPQANFLQDPANPLAPTDFVVALRTPGPEGDVEERSPSYRTARGYRAWYTGGEVFYHRLHDAPLCVEPDPDPMEALVDGVRAFLLASAIRLMRCAEGTTTPALARAARFETKEEAKRRLPAVASMLVHPSSARDAHFNVADALVQWSHGSDAGDGHERRLGMIGVSDDLRDNRGRWLSWLSAYRATAGLCASELGGEAPWIPSGDDWAAVERVILEDVVPGTTIAVVNSDERADDRPEFDVQPDSDGWRAPRNLSTIFVSGNVMSRGLTLEGLTTTVFTREASDPMADTQMQMQRWFGYRGPYLELCRVLAPRSQLRLFAEYHDNDEALRRQVIRAMADNAAPPDLAVLQGLTHRATGKVAGLRGRRLWPGPRPFVQQMNPPIEDAHNHAVVAGVLAAGVRGVPDDGAARGVLAEEMLSLDDAADLLDDLRYPGLQPTAVERWAGVEHLLALAERDPRRPLYRGPARQPKVWTGTSPYDLAAYFRTWAALLEQQAPGFVTTDDPPLRWSLLDLEERRRRTPRFRVALRFGSGPAYDAGPLGSLPVQVRPMEREVREGDVLDATWGSRGASADGILGDEFFDYHGDERPRLTRDGIRSSECPGLLLFHLVARRDGPPTLALGVSIPAGGPDQVVAVGPRTRE
ncbi:Z1 domain-containing protein [Nocardioides marmotae]|uniref:Z1 domain-containing protein n=1 Tax=Nocardioides marmotae TaxID=2663857 RepID=UPI0012B63F7C|nr:Z1 domain-containing protein [Nocardioides marmotae]MTB85461.1 hypothetical protein [Nocardioides marmotae]